MFEQCNRVPESFAFGKYTHEELPGLQTQRTRYCIETVLVLKKTGGRYDVLDMYLEYPSICVKSNIMMRRKFRNYQNFRVNIASNFLVVTLRMVVSYVMSNDQSFVANNNIKIDFSGIRWPFIVLSYW